MRIIAKNKGERDIFLIPPNFLNEGSLFGGMLKLRNTLEAVILVAGITIPILKITVFSFTAKIILLCLTALPIGIFALIGIGGESLTAFLLNFIRKKAPSAPVPRERKRGPALVKVSAPRGIIK